MFLSFGVVMFRSFDENCFLIVMMNVIIMLVFFKCGFGVSVL